MARPSSTNPKKNRRLVVLLDIEEDNRARDLARRFYAGNMSATIRGALIALEKSKTNETAAVTE